VAPTFLLLGIYNRLVKQHGSTGSPAGRVPDGDQSPFGAKEKNDSTYDNSKQENGHNISTSDPVRDNASLGIWAAEGASPVGLWKNEDAKIENLKTAGSCTVKIAALNEKYTKDGQKKTDIHNPDPAKRERPLIGLVVMKEN